MPAPESVKQLIDTFANNIDFYKCGMGEPFFIWIPA